MSRIAIISNYNGIGLQRDAELLQEFLEELGHEVYGIQFDDPDAVCGTADLAIYLEVVPRDKLGISMRRWLFANHEWVKMDMVPVVNKFFERVFAKTQEGKRVLDKLFPEKVFYTGFMARDRLMKEVERKPWFLHVGGNSSLRGTQAVVDAWKWLQDGKRIDAHLIIVSRALKDRPPLPLVTYHEVISDEELQSYQNECAFHLQPSEVEGYGHAIREAMSTDNVLVVTDAPPMHEIQAAVYFETCSKGSYNFATTYQVSALEIYNRCQEMLKLWPEYDERGLFRPRAEFLNENRAFKQRFKVQLEAEKPPRPTTIKKKKDTKEIAFLGNFENEESTENMVKWALEDLGHQVWPIQENHVGKMSDIEDYTRGSDLFLWIHTRTWLKIPDEQMHEFLLELRTNRVNSCSMHLDRFWGLPAREKEFSDPFWRTEFVFTADGGSQGHFDELGIKHHWLKPAVSKVYCHPGVVRDEFVCDVGFVGARDYHDEYPFRRELVDGLEEIYGNRFKHITGVRGHRLNDFYASCKVVVGDCIFAGVPRYWSDRLPETCGRGGFLLHPKCTGLSTPVPVYDPQNLGDLRYHIGYWLAQDEWVRKNVRNLAMKHVWEHDTWTTRMHEIFKVIYG
jgi:hypothetical protein